MKQTSSIRSLLVLAITLMSTGCPAAQDSRKANTEERAAVRDRLEKSGTRPATPAGGGAQTRAARTDSGPPLERMAGYVVRGTDESSFRRCGSKRTHYIRAAGEAAVHLVTQYRFKASTPLAPVYFVFRARVIEDSVRVGDYLYTSVVEVRSVDRAASESTPECPAPMRGSMIADR